MWFNILKIREYVENPAGDKIYLDVPNDEAHSWGDIKAAKIEFAIKGREIWEMVDFLRENQKMIEKEIDIAYFEIEIGGEGKFYDRHIRNRVVKDWLEPILLKLGFTDDGHLSYRHPDFKAVLVFYQDTKLKMGGAITSTSGGNSATTRGIETFVRYGGDKDGEEDSEE